MTTSGTAYIPPNDSDEELDQEYIKLLPIDDIYILQIPVQTFP